jgi:hypothetical protein
MSGSPCAASLGDNLLLAQSAGVCGFKCSILDHRALRNYLYELAFAPLPVVSALFKIIKVFVMSCPKCWVRQVQYTSLLVAALFKHCARVKSVSI